MAQDIANGSLHSASFMWQIALTGGASSFIAKSIARGALAGVGKVGGKQIAGYLGKEILKDGTTAFLKTTANELTKQGAGKSSSNCREKYIRGICTDSINALYPCWCTRKEQRKRRKFF